MIRAAALGLGLLAAAVGADTRLAIDANEGATEDFGAALLAALAMGAEGGAPTFHGDGIETPPGL